MAASTIEGLAGEAGLGAAGLWHHAVALRSHSAAAEARSSLIVPAFIVLPQIFVALIAPWAGRQANNRPPLLLIGFGALPVRALLFVLVAGPPLALAFQLLDGISGAVVGVM